MGKWNTVGPIGVCKNPDCPRKGAPFRKDNAKVLLCPECHANRKTIYRQQNRAKVAATAKQNRARYAAHAAMLAASRQPEDAARPPITLQDLPTDNSTKFERAIERRLAEIYRR